MKHMYFQKEWLDSKLHPLFKGWLAPVENDIIFTFLRYTLTRAVSSLSPVKMLDCPGIAKKRFGKAVECLLDCNLISTTEAEKACNQYQTFISTEGVKLKLKTFTTSEDSSLDLLFSSLLKENRETKDLWKCFKIFLLLSHGNATVEGGFSVNDDLLVENLKERSVVAQRLVYDGIRQAGDSLAVEIDKQMLDKARSAYSAYKIHLEKIAKAERQGVKGSEEQKKNILLLKEKTEKRKRLREEAEQTETEIVALKKMVGKKIRVP